MANYTDLTVRTGSAELLDSTLRQLPMALAVVVDGTWDPDRRTCTVRVFGNVGFVKFALANQGYGEVLAEESFA
jgi:hypothetical protein